MQWPARNLSVSVPQPSQIMLVVMPAQSRQTSPPPEFLPGRSLSSPQFGQDPRVRSAVVKQIPHIGPSGQVTRIFAAKRPHRAHRWSPWDRGRPRVPGLVVVNDPGPDGFVGVSEPDDVFPGSGGLLLAFGPGVGGSKSEQLVRFDAVDVAEGSQELERDPFGFWLTMR
jgi:hypothetical protein